MGATFVSDAALTRRLAAVRAAPHGDALIYACSVAGVAGTYYLAGKVGLKLAYLDGAVAAVWPPAGLGLAVLFAYGIRLWPGIVISDLLLADFSTPPGTVVAQTVGNTLAVVIEPPDTGAGGRWLSPNAGWICSSGMPVTSETIWAMVV